MTTPTRSVLMVTDFFYPMMGGSVRVAYELGAALADQGARVEVLTRQSSPDLPERERLGPLEVERFPVRERPWPALWTSLATGAVRRYRRLESRQGTPDVLHLHHTLSTLGLHLAGVSRRVPTIATCEGPLAEEFAIQARHNSVQSSTFNVQSSKSQDQGPQTNGLHSTAIDMTAAFLARAQRYHLEHCRAIVVLSRYMREQVETLVPERRRPPIAIIPPGVDIRRFTLPADRAGVRARLGFAPEDFVLLAVRRLVPRMGLDVLLEAVAALAPRMPNLRLVIGGQGYLLESLQRQTERLGLAGRVRFTGYVADDELPLYYQAADLAILPTLAAEGFGLPILEALASGCPILGTRVGAIAEVLEPIELAWIIDTPEPESIAAAIAGYVESARHTAWPAQAARCRAFAAQFTWDRTARAYQELYTEVGTVSPAHVFQFGRQGQPHLPTPSPLRRRGGVTLDLDRKQPLHATTLPYGSPSPPQRGGGQGVGSTHTTGR